MFHLAAGAKNVTQERFVPLHSTRFSPVAAPGSAPPDDFWAPVRFGLLGPPPKIVRDGTF